MFHQCDTDDKSEGTLGLAQNQKPKTPKQNRSADQGKEHSWLEKFAVAVAILAFLAAGWQGYIARDTERRSLRAYLSVSPDYIYSFPADKAPVRIRATIRNHGQTPANDMVQSVRKDILPYPLPPNFQFPALDAATESRPTVAPGGLIYVERSADRLFSEAEIRDAVIQEKSRIYVFGTVSYLDVFEISVRR
jgi:hypothetical protein